MLNCATDWINLCKIVDFFKCIWPKNMILIFKNIVIMGFYRRFLNIQEKIEIQIYILNHLISLRHEQNVSVSQDCPVKPLIMKCMLHLT